MYKLLFTILMVLSLDLTGQQKESLTLEKCYSEVKSNYPLLEQQKIIEIIASNKVRTISAGRIPQMSVNGQASYQSDVTTLPLKVPGMELAAPSKNQYKVYAEVSQMIYDGGLLKAQTAHALSESKMSQAKLEVDLYKLKDRVNKLFFGILLLQEKLKQQKLVGNDIENGLAKMKAALQNGTVLKSNVALLEAELLFSEQRIIELNSEYRSMIETLGFLMGRDLSTTEFIKPADLNISNEILRPELKLFHAQSQMYDAALKMLNSKRSPKVNLFLLAGGGRPGLNMLSNQFDKFYTGGVKVSWNLNSFYTHKNEKIINESNRKMNDAAKETFLFETRSQLIKHSEEIIKIKQLLTSDAAIVNLRKEIKKAAFAQLENGVITSNDFLREVYAEDRAKLQVIIHELELSAAYYNAQNLQGN